MWLQGSGARELHFIHSILFLDFEEKQWKCNKYFRANVLKEQWSALGGKFVILIFMWHVVFSLIKVLFFSRGIKPRVITEYMEDVEEYDDKFICHYFILIP